MPVAEHSHAAAGIQKETVDVAVAVTLPSCWQRSGVVEKQTLQIQQACQAVKAGRTVVFQQPKSSYSDEDSE